MDIKYRKGIPTQKSMWALIETYYKGTPNIRPSVSQLYGTGYGDITWQKTGTQEKILGFIGFLAGYEIKIEKYNPYESPRVGMFNITPK